MTTFRVPGDVEVATEKVREAARSLGWRVEDRSPDVWLLSGSARKFGLGVLAGSDIPIVMRVEVHPGASDDSIVGVTRLARGAAADLVATRQFGIRIGQLQTLLEV